MRLIHAWIDGYKHLKNTSVSFRQTSDEGVFKGAMPIRFFIGLNGSGKSVFLEALCLVFSRVAQNEVPGFDFALSYCIQRQGKEYRVDISNGSGLNKLNIKVCVEGNSQTYTFTSFVGHMELLPDHVFTCASGHNNNFFDIMMKSPKDSLYSDLFDASLLGKSKRTAQGRRDEIEQALYSLKRLEEDPIGILIDEPNAVLVLIAFWAASPGSHHSDAAKGYLNCKREIREMLTSAPRPVSAALVLDEKRLHELGNELAEYGPLFSVVCAQKQQNEYLCAWNSTRHYQDETVDAVQSHGDRVITFLFESYGDEAKEEQIIQCLSDAYPNPMELLSKLILARNKGIIKDAHIAFRIQGTDNLLLENALSEGEYMLLVRLGLLALGRTGDTDCQCLYLLDEPDVYLNEHWNIDFVSMIHRLYQDTVTQHEIIIATHSSLILTDALPDQLYYFQQKEQGVGCYNIKASTFGGSRNEIMQALFQTRNSVGNYAYEKVNTLLESVDNIDELEKLLEQVGSGYLRLRLLDKIQILKESRG